jgi:hypothetical protein
MPQKYINTTHNCALLALRHPATIFSHFHIMFSPVHLQSLLRMTHVKPLTICSHLLTLVPRLRIFLPRRWRRDVPPKLRFTQDLHGATSQKTAFFTYKKMLGANLGRIIIYFVAVCGFPLCFQAKVEDSPSEQAMNTFYTILIYVACLSR